MKWNFRSSKRKKKQAPKKSGNPSKSISLKLENLEERVVPTIGFLTPDFVLHDTPANEFGNGVYGGYAPAQVRSAYGITNTSGVNQIIFPGNIVGDGTGQTIAIVDGYSQPDIKSDLQHFDTRYGLPAPPSFKIVNENGGSDVSGYAAPPGGWGVEISLDVEWAHSIAPGANLVLVECDTNLNTGVVTASNLASVVSMSWGTGTGESANGEYSGETSVDHIFNVPGVAFLGATGDNGYATYPEYSPYVIAVGGTSITIDGYTYDGEAGWSGSGGGLSLYESRPSYQNGVASVVGSHRGNPDVSAIADPNTGVSVYDSYDGHYGYGVYGSNWFLVGGTSLATPVWAGFMSIVDQGRVSMGLGTLDSVQALTDLYDLPSTDFHDITSGSNAKYTAGPGYDLVTGLGSPVANLLIPGLVMGITNSSLANWDQDVSGYNQTLSASGGSGSYTFSLESGTSLPTGLSLNGNTGAITGEPTATGSFTFTIIVTDSNQDTASKQFTIAISAQPTLGSASLPAWDVNLAGYKTSVSGSGGTGSLSYGVASGSSLPPGLSIDSSTGAITGTPTQTGTFNFTLEVTDSVDGTGTQSYSITINSAPSITTNSLPNWDKGLANYNATVQAGGGTGALKYTIASGGSLPAGLSINSSTGAITGTPTTAATYNFTVVVTDSVGDSASQAYSVTINADPAISTASLPAWDVNVSGYSSSISANGGTGALTYSLKSGTSLPAGLSLDSGSGAITGEPTSTGTVSFTVVVTDTLGESISKALSITINSQPTLPTAMLPAWDVSFSSYKATVSGTGGTGTLTYSVESGYSLPPGLSISAAGAITGTPTQTGTYNFNLQVTDSVGGVGTQSYSITINSDPSITTNSLPNWDKGLANYNATVQAGGGTGALKYTIASGGSLPAGLSINSSTGAITGTPTTAATYNFTVVVTDSVGDSASQGYSVTINADPTISTATLPAWDVNVSGYSSSISANGGTGALTYSLKSGTSLPTGLSLDSGSGAITGEPTSTGTVSFTVVVTDTLGESISKALSITINSQPTLPTAMLPAWDVSFSSYKATVSGTGGTGTLTYSVESGYSLPPGLSISSAGAITGTPTQTGTFNFNLQVTDSVGGVGTQSYSIVINSAPAISTSSLPNWDKGLAYSQTVQAGGGTGTLKYSIKSGTTLPAGLSINSSTGAITGTPTTATTYNFTVVVTDSVGATTSQAYTVVINADPAISTTSLPAWDVNVSGYSGSIAVTGGTGALTYSLKSGTSLPAGLSLSSSTGQITGEPTATGTVSFTVIVTDSLNETVSKALSIAVNAQPTLPTATLPTWDLNYVNYKATLAATGGTGTYSYSLQSGSSLPPGLSLSSAGAITGTPTQTGNVSFTVVVTDGVGGTGTQSYSIDINSAPAISTNSLANWDVGVKNYSQTVDAGGGTGTLKYTIKSGTSLPAGLSISSSTGAITGTPSKAATYNFTVLVTDSVGDTASQAFTVVINALPTITTKILSGWDVNQPNYDQNVLASGGTGSLTYSLKSGSSLPAGLSLSSSTGQITGTPTALGSTSFTIVVTDSLNQSASQVYTVIINKLPTLTASNLATWDQTFPGYKQTVVGAGGTGTLTYSVESGYSLPPGLSISAAGTITGTPTQTGTFNFNLEVTDVAGGTGTQSYSITIDPPPSIGTASLTNWDKGFAGYKQNVDGSGGTGTLKYSLKSGTSLPTGLSLNSSTGAITGTPSATGTFNFTVIVTDGIGDTASQAYSVVINADPTITTKTLSNWDPNITGYDAAIAGTGGTNGLSYTLKTGSNLPPGLSLSTSGVITGTPTTTGSYTFTVVETDGVGDTATATYTVVISDPSFQTASLPNGTLNSNYSQTVKATGGMGALTYGVETGYSLPPGLTINSATGAITGKPTATGTYTFYLEVTDSLGVTETQQYKIIVT